MREKFLRKSRNYTVAYGLTDEHARRLGPSTLLMTDLHGPGAQVGG